MGSPSNYSSHGFHLVLTNPNGIAQPLPAELGPLPLYLDEDGFSSVLGPPLNQTTCHDQAQGSSNSALTYDSINTSPTLTPPREKVFCGSSRCSGNRFTSPSITCLPFVSTNPEKWSTHLLSSLLHL
ncbi:hypothetical protein HOY80DRAFT_999725 [Tuber brumale]|nr:hypothetical protein HOY80DRAFT_999725 [Tuber brumale]